MDVIRNRGKGRMCARRMAVGVAFVVLAGMPAWGERVTLETCIEAALSANPDLQAAAHRVKEARAAQAQARAVWYPRILASGTYARTDNPTQAFMMAMNQRTLDMADPSFNPSDPGDADNLRVSLGLSYLLYDGGRRGLDTRMADQDTARTRYAGAAVRNTLVHEVTRAYYGALQAEAFLVVHDDTVASVEESLRIARARLEAGSALSTDVLNLEVQGAQAQEDRIRARNGARLALAALNTAIGEEIARAGSLDAAVAEPPAPPAVPEAEARRALIEARPELRAMRQVLDLRDAGVERARREYAPTVSTFGSMDWDSDLSRSAERSYLAGVMLEWEVFDGARRKRAVEGAQARSAEVRARYAALRKQIDLDMTEAHLQIADAWERMGVARRTIASAEEVLRITRERYEEGAAEITELLNAQLALTATRTRHTAAYFDYLTARSNVERAEGRHAYE